MAYIEIIHEEQAEGLLAKIYNGAQSRAGGVANILKVMSRDPAVLQGSMALYVNLMKSPNALSSTRRELLATVVSNVNDCYY
jgi:alkylhydroperoxidase family enzyme